MRKGEILTAGFLLGFFFVPSLFLCAFSIMRWRTQYRLQRSVPVKREGTWLIWPRNYLVRKRYVWGPVVTRSVFWVFPAAIGVYKHGKKLIDLVAGRLWLSKEERIGTALGVYRLAEKEGSDDGTRHNSHNKHVSGAF